METLEHRVAPFFHVTTLYISSECDSAHQDWETLGKTLLAACREHSGHGGALAWPTKPMSSPFFLFVRRRRCEINEETEAQGGPRLGLGYGPVSGLGYGPAARFG